jgi:hypothetical protein
MWWGILPHWGWLGIDRGEGVHEAGRGRGIRDPRVGTQEEGESVFFLVGVGVWSGHRPEGGSGGQAVRGVKTLASRKLKWESKRY